MSTLTNVDFHSPVSEVIRCVGVEKVRAGAQRPGREERTHTRRTRDPEHGMNTMSAGSTSLRSASVVAEARRTAQAFLDALWQPAIGPEHSDTVVLVVS